MGEDKVLNKASWHWGNKNIEIKRETNNIGRGARQKLGIIHLETGRIKKMKTDGSNYPGLALILKKEGCKLFPSLFPLNRCRDEKESIPAAFCLRAAAF